MYQPETEAEMANQETPAEQSLMEPSFSEPMTAKAFHFPQPCVYCGPSMKGVARQYTVYTAGVPRPLEAFIQEHPLARGLVVPVERFPAVRQALEQAGSRESILYQKIQAAL